MNQTITGSKIIVSETQSTILETSNGDSLKISPTTVLGIESTASPDTPENPTHKPDPKSFSADFLHRQFLTLGKERHKLTHKLLALLPRIYKEKVYEAHGYATIYEYAGKLAGLSHSTVEKALKLDEKLKGKPHLQKAIETQGIHKVAIVANLATPENEKMFADKVINMSKPALQEYSKELRGKISGKLQTTWQIELDCEMMTMFLKLKGKLGKFGKRLSNKEALRRMLKKLNEETLEKKAELAREEKRDACLQAKIPHDFPGEIATTACHSRPDRESTTGMTVVKNLKPQTQAKKPTKIPGDFPKTELNTETKSSEIPQENFSNLPAPPNSPKITRYIPVSKKRPALAQTNNKCAHGNCHRPAEILHHQLRFSAYKSHDSIIPLCRIHHEYAHNGITEPLSGIDTLYRKYRRIAIS